MTLTEAGICFGIFAQLAAVVAFGAKLSEATKYNKELNCELKSDLKDLREEFQHFVEIIMKRQESLDRRGARIEAVCEDRHGARTLTLKERPNV